MICYEQGDMNFSREAETTNNVEFREENGRAISWDEDFWTRQNGTGFEKKRPRKVINNKRAGWILGLLLLAFAFGYGYRGAWEWTLKTEWHAWGGQEAHTGAMVLQFLLLFSVWLVESDEMHWLLFIVFCVCIDLGAKWLTLSEFLKMLDWHFAEPHHCQSGNFLLSI